MSPEPTKSLFLRSNYYSPELRKSSGFVRSSYCSTMSPKSNKASLLSRSSSVRHCDLSRASFSSTSTMESRNSSLLSTSSFSSTSSGTSRRSSVSSSSSLCSSGSEYRQSVYATNFWNQFSRGIIPSKKKSFWNSVKSKLLSKNKEQKLDISSKVTTKTTHPQGLYDPIDDFLSSYDGIESSEENDQEESDNAVTICDQYAALYSQGGINFSNLPHYENIENEFLEVEEEKKYIYYDINPYEVENIYNQIIYE